MSLAFNLDFQDSISTTEYQGLPTNTFVRLSYKKEKQTNYRVRMGIVKEVTPDYLMLEDYTTDLSSGYLNAPAIRKFLWSRIGEVEIYSKIDVSHPTSPDQVSFTLPQGHIALVKIGPPDLVNKKVSTTK